MIDQAKIAHTAAILMDRVEAELGESAEILDAMIVVEVAHGEGSTTLTQFSTTRLSVQEGLCVEAACVTLWDRLAGDDE